MKKSLKFLLTIVVLLCSLICLGGCVFSNPTDTTKHEHNYVIRTVEPTCTTDGYTEKVCSGCGDTVKTNIVAALGHNFSTSYTVDIEPTCTANGEKSCHCSRCSAKNDVRTIPALGHNYSTTWSIDAQPSCLQAGIKSHHCTRCDSAIDQTNFDEPLGHLLNESITPPTCEEKGYTKHFCIRCNYSYNTDYINELGHNIISTEIVEPTCLTGGYTKYNCSRCAGYSDNHSEPLGHLYLQGHCVRCNQEDPNYYVVTALTDSYAEWCQTPNKKPNSYTNVIKLSENATNFIISKGNDLIRLNVEFELKSDKNWQLYSKMISISGSSTQEGIKHYYNGSESERFSTNNYVKYSYSIDVTASEFKNGSIYFCGHNRGGFWLDNSWIYVKNIKIGIGEAS